MDIDPDFSIMDDDFTEDYVYDTYDRIIEDTDEDPEGELYDPEYLEDNALDATTLGLAFAFADEIAAAERAAEKQSKYDVDEHTDAENMKLVSLMSRADTQGHGRLKPFEQYVQSLCSGGRTPLSRGVD